MIKLPLGRQMRRLLPLLFAIVAVLFGFGPARADDLVLERFGAYLEALRSQFGVPGLAAVMVGSSDITWEGAYGKQDLECSIATRTDTPFHVDGLTQMFTASLIMRCVEEGALSLDDRVGQFAPAASEPNATVRQLLMHTSGTGGFQYRPERLDPLASVIATCSTETFRAKLAKGFEWLAMNNSVVGSRCLAFRESNSFFASVKPG